MMLRAVIAFLALLVAMPTVVAAQRWRPILRDSVRALVLRQPLDRLFEATRPTWTPTGDAARDHRITGNMVLL